MVLVEVVVVVVDVALLAVVVVVVVVVVAVVELYTVVAVVDVCLSVTYAGYFPCSPQILALLRGTVVHVSSRP